MPSATLRDALKTTQATAPIVSAAGTIVGGFERQGEANAQSNQLIRNAGAAQAVGQRNALNSDLMTRLALSRGTAVAAASGAGVTDPTVENIQATTAARGQYAALTDLYNGNSQAQSDMMRAAYTRQAGNLAMAQTSFDATKTLAGSAKTLLDRYGGQLPSWMGGTSGQNVEDGGLDG